MISPILCLTGGDQKGLFDLDPLTYVFVQLAVNVCFSVFFLFFIFFTSSKCYRSRQITKLPDCLLHLFQNTLVHLYSGEYFTVQ